MAPGHEQAVRDACVVVPLSVAHACGKEGKPYRMLGSTSAKCNTDEVGACAHVSFTGRTLRSRTRMMGGKRERARPIDGTSDWYPA